MIQSHLYTNKNATGLYHDRGESAAPVCVLGQGTWLGELERSGHWIHVISIQGEGWVRAEDTESRSPFNLHVQWTPGKPIEYVSSAA
ncbi:MAG TPA: hypothetical protein VFG10_01310 [Saprospiraceae bacterium]|nr:hypothetical protein [Saprospiraceae bacterium]